MPMTHPIEFGAKVFSVFLTCRSAPEAACALFVARATTQAMAALCEKVLMTGEMSRSRVHAIYRVS